MADEMTRARAVDARTLRAMLVDGAELALLDVREERIYSESHLLFARSAPMSRLELRMARLGGFGFLEWVKKHTECAVIPTIVLSVSDLDSDVRRAYLSAAETISSASDYRRAIVRVLE